MTLLCRGHPCRPERPKPKVPILTDSRSEGQTTAAGIGDGTHDALMSSPSDGYEAAARRLEHCPVQRASEHAPAACCFGHALAGHRRRRCRHRPRAPHTRLTREAVQWFQSGDVAVRRERGTEYRRAHVASECTAMGRTRRARQHYRASRGLRRSRADCDATAAAAAGVGCIQKESSLRRGWRHRCAFERRLRVVLVLAAPSESAAQAVGPASADGALLRNTHRSVPRCVGPPSGGHTAGHDAAVDAGGERALVRGRRRARHGGRPFGQRREGVVGAFEREEAQEGCTACNHVSGAAVADDVVHDAARTAGCPFGHERTAAHHLGLLRLGLLVRAPPIEDEHARAAARP